MRNARKNMLKLSSIGLSDYTVLESGQRIGRIRLATERIPCVWLRIPGITARDSD